MLPVEILDNIFSRLDIFDLQESSLAHLLFSRIAERYLYADISLEPHRTKWTWQRDEDSTLSFTVVQLSDLLSERPRIANYVFSLTISFPDIYEASLPSPAVRSLLQNLRKITIGGPGWSTDLELPENFWLSLDNWLRLPSVQELGVTEYVKIPPTFLHHCKDIKTLKINASSISELGDPELDSSHDGPLLKDLTIIGVHQEVLNRLAPGIAKCCKQLQYFTFSPHFSGGEAFAAIAPIFISCSDTLTSLEIRLRSRCKPI